MLTCVVHHWPVYGYVQFLYSAQSYQIVFIGGQKEENLPGPHRLDQLMRPSQTQYCLGSTNNTRHNIYSFCNKENYNKSLRV